MFINLSLLLLLAAAAADPSSSPTQLVEVADGGNATLVCYYKGSDEVTLTKWSFSDINVIIFRSGDLNPNDQGEQFKGKVSFLYPGNKKDFSITISSVDQTYNGIYTCEVRNKRGLLFKSTSNLIVLKESPKDSLEHQTTPNDTNSLIGPGFALLVGAVLVVFAGFLHTVKWCQKKCERLWTWVRGVRCWTKPNTEGQPPEGQPHEGEPHEEDPLNAKEGNGKRQPRRRQQLAHGGQSGE